MHIDFHAHVLAREILSGRGPVDWRPVIVPQANGGYMVQNAQHINGPMFLPMVDPAEIIARRREIGIDLTVVSPPPDAFFYELAPSENASQLQNDGLARMVADHPQHLAALGTLPLQDVPLAVKELERVMAELRLVGVEISSNINGAELGDPRFSPFWEAAEALGAVVLVHPSFFQSLGGDRLKPYDLRRLMGNLLETACAAAHLVFSGTLEAYPELKIILVHGGGVLPYLVGRLDHGYRVRSQAREKLPHLPSSYVTRFYYDTVTHYAPALQYLVNLVGADHVVLGSDYPFDMGDEHQVDFVNGIPGLSQANRDQILSGTALRLLGTAP